MSTPTDMAATADEDLADLLEDQGTAKKNHLEMTPLNLDHLTKGQLDVNPNTKVSGGDALVHLTSNSCKYLAYAHPKLCGCLVVTCVLLGFTLCLNLIMNPIETFGNVEEDFSNIRSKFDLDAGKIDHWCIKGDNNSCRCEDPLEPTSRGEFQTWTRAHKANKDLLKEASGKNIEVAFLGESLVEEMGGRWMGQTKGAQLQVLRKMFETKWTAEKSGVEGIALGIAGDTSPNVLWRLLHGEMPQDFNPKIWWLSLGMNDLGRMQCSEEVVVMGILRVVEEILDKKPDAHVVINSMLPMADLRGGIYPHVQDYQDAFKKYKGHATVDQTRVARKPPKQSDEKNKNAKEIDEKNKKKNGRFLKRKDRKREQLNKAIEEGEDPKNPEPLKKGLKRINKKDPYNPKLISREKIRKYNSKKLFMQQNRLPLWTSITAINKELFKFCRKNSDRVSFFDATSIFAERSDGRTYVLQSNKISVRGHPTVAGYEAWETRMLDRVKKILKEQDATAKDESPWKEGVGLSTPKEPKKKKSVVREDEDDSDEDYEDNEGSESSSSESESE